MKNELYILYAEDNVDDIFIMQQSFKAIHTIKKLITVSHGYEVIRFLQKVEKGKAFPCLIVLDMHMPKLDGKETLDLLKTDDLYRLIPVLMFTGDHQVVNDILFKQLYTEVWVKPDTLENWQQLVRFICCYTN